MTKRNMTSLTFRAGRRSFADPEVGVRRRPVVAEVRDEEGLSVDDDDAARLDVVDPVEGRDLLRTGIIQTIGESGLAEVDLERATPGDDL